MTSSCSGAKDDTLGGADRDAAVEPDARDRADAEARDAGDETPTDASEMNDASPADASPADASAADAEAEASAGDGGLDAATEASIAEAGLEAGSDAAGDGATDASAADADANADVVSPCPSQTLAVTTFNTGDEGWRMDELTYPSVGSPPNVLGTYVPTFQASGGNPDGHLRYPDPGNNAGYWRAPSSFVGNVSSAYGGSLRFDLSVTGNGGTTPGFTQEDVVLVTTGYTLVADIQFIATPTATLTWRSFVVPFLPSAWRRNTRTGTVATEAELRAALQSLSALYIRGEYLNGLDDVLYFDNVGLCRPTE